MERGARSQIQTVLERTFLIRIWAWIWIWDFWFEIGCRILDLAFGILEFGFRILDFDDRNWFWVGGTVLDAAHGELDYIFHISQNVSFTFSPVGSQILDPFRLSTLHFSKAGGLAQNLLTLKHVMFTFSALFYPLLTWKFNLHFFTPRPLQGRSPCQAMIETHRVVNVTNQPTNQQVPLCSGWPGESTGHLPRIRPTAQLSLVVCFFCEKRSIAPRRFLDSNPKSWKIDGRSKKQQQQQQQ